MTIISTTDISKKGSDCYIYNSVTLVEQFNMYAIIVCCRPTGWFSDCRDIRVDSFSDSYEEMVKRYEHLGGKIEKEGT